MKKYSSQSSHVYINSPSGPALRTQGNSLPVASPPICSANGLYRESNPRAPSVDPVNPSPGHARPIGSNPPPGTTRSVLWTSSHTDYHLGYPFISLLGTAPEPTASSSHSLGRPSLPLLRTSFTQTVPVSHSLEHSLLPLLGMSPAQTFPLSHYLGHPFLSFPGT